MANLKLKEPLATIEGQIIKVMMAARSGRWPESYSDMQISVRAMLRMFKVELANEPVTLEMD